jgi:hypothetical protein
MNLALIAEKSKGKFFTVRFIKKDGSVRTMHCRLGVTKHSKGGDNHLDPAQFLTVWDLHSKGYRAVNKDTILSVTVGHVSWLNVKEQ